MPAAQLVARLLSLPEPAKRLLRGNPVVKRGNTLDPDVQLIMRLERFIPSVNRFSVDAARKVLDFNVQMLRGRTYTVKRTQWHAINDEVALREFEPRDARDDGSALLYIHGGGFVTGSVETHEDVARALAVMTGLRVFSLRYRLAPEYPFPAAVDDSLLAWHWLQQQQSALGIAGERIVVGGDSAGGNLSAVLCQQLRKYKGNQPLVQLLIYPATDLRHGHPSMREFAEGPFLTREVVHWFRHRYIANQQIPLTDSRLSPLCADEVNALPPAIITIAGFDPLQDEGRAYADKLAAAGNEVILLEETSQIHGYVNMAGRIDSAHEALDRIASTLNRLLAELAERQQPVASRTDGERKKRAPGKKSPPAKSSKDKKATAKNTTPAKKSGQSASKNVGKKKAGKPAKKSQSATAVKRQRAKSSASD